METITQERTRQQIAERARSYVNVVKLANKNITLIRERKASDVSVRFLVNGEPDKEMNDAYEALIQVAIDEQITSLQKRIDFLKNVTVSGGERFEAIYINDGTSLDVASPSPF